MLGKENKKKKILSTQTNCSPSQINEVHHKEMSRFHVISVYMDIYNFYDLYI